MFRTIFGLEDSLYSVNSGIIMSLLAEQRFDEGFFVILPLVVDENGRDLEYISSDMTLDNEVADVFSASFSKSQLDSWRNQKITDAAIKAEVEKVLQRGKK